jgi:hypothetical protein
LARVRPSSQIASMPETELLAAVPPRHSIAPTLAEMAPIGPAEAAARAVLRV